jgi:hypothetical protein
MLVSVIVRWLNEDHSNNGTYAKSRSLAFCSDCALDVYEYLRGHLDRARMERVG